MQNLRRRFATLWPSTSTRDLQARDAGDHAGAAEEVGDHSGATPSSSRANGQLLSSRATDGTPASEQHLPPVGIDSSSSTGRLRGRAEGIGDPLGDDTLVPATPRVLKLAHPWGSADPTPPQNWSSQHHSPTRTTFKSASKARLRRPVRGEDDAFSDAAVFSDAVVLSDSHSINNNNADMTTTQSAAAAAAATTTVTALTSPSTLLVEHREEQQTRSSTKRKQRGAAETGGEDNFTTTAAARGGGDGNSMDQLVKPKPYRRRRTCPADSTFVSPMKRSTSQATYSATGTTPFKAETAQLALHEEDEEEASAHHARIFPPSHLIFRAGFFKALSGRRRRRPRGSSAAATEKSTETKPGDGGGSSGGNTTSDSSKGQPPNRFKRRTKDLHALIARHAFNSAYSAQAGTDGAAAEEAAREARVMVEAAAVAAARRSGIEGDAVWERVNRHELEQDEEAEKRGAARLRRLQAL